MDYKYIKQLLERYWQCETTLEEEEILRTFFSQKDVPAELLTYKPLFNYQLAEPKTDVLGSDFDDKLLKMVNEQEPVKAKVVSLSQRLRPLFKAAAVVAIVLTIGNAAQLPFKNDTVNYTHVRGLDSLQKGVSVAMTDSAVMDTVKHTENMGAAGNLLK